MREEKRQHGNATHGQSRTLLYKIWSDMWQRCRNPKRPAYANYGGRGITVTTEWRSFEQFRIDVGERPGLEYRLERRENDKGYTQNNVYWATAKQQARNRRSNHVLEFNGEKKTLAEWSEQSGIASFTIAARLKQGWTKEKALTALPRPHPKFYFEGEVHSLRGWAKKLGIAPSTLSWRIRQGWPDERIFAVAGEKNVL